MFRSRRSRAMAAMSAIPSVHPAHLMPAFRTRELVRERRFLHTIPAQIPVVRGAIIDVMRVVLGAQSAFEGHVASQGLRVT